MGKRERLDLAAAADILRVQSGGNLKRADAITRKLKKMPGATLHERWLQLIAWEWRGRKPTPHERAQIRAMIQNNADLARRLAS